MTNETTTTTYREATIKTWNEEGSDYVYGSIIWEDGMEVAQGAFEANEAIEALQQVIDNQRDETTIWETF